MTKRLLFGAIILSVIALGALWAWERFSARYEESTGPVRVSPAKRVIESDPDDFVTLVFTLRNLSDRELSYELHAEVPAGWELLDPPQHSTVGPHAHEEIFLTVRVPPGAPAREYWLGLRAQSDELWASGRARIVVRARERLKLSLAESDLILRPHEEKRLSLIVTNRGNISARVALAVTAAPAGWQFRLGESSFALGPAQSKTAALTVRPLPDAPIAPARFTVQATSPASRDELSFTVVLSP